MESVDCQECGQRYDSQENAFCPRCGSEGRAPAAEPTQQAASRRDPSRRRVQIGGVIMLVMGLLSTVLYASVAFTAPDLIPQFSEELLADQPGGSVAISLVSMGMPAAGVNVTAYDMSGMPFANGTTNENGTLNLDIADHAAANVTIHGEPDISRNVLALDGTTTKLHLDLDSAEASDAWVGLDTLVTAMRGMLAFFIAMSLLVAFGGFAAIKLRWRPVAMGGGIVGIVPGLVMAVAIPNFGSLLILLLMALALSFIIFGRHHFR